MSYYYNIERITKTGIDFKTAASTLIGTTRGDDRKFHPLIVMFTITSASTITIPATCSVGTNSTTYNNILAASALTGMTAVDTLLIFNLNTTTPILAASTDIYVKVTVGATATTMTGDVTILGFYK